MITAGATGVDILDGDKFQCRPGVCSRTAETFSLGGDAFIANIEGPGMTFAEAQGRVTAACFPIVVENTTSTPVGAPPAND